MTTKYGVLNAPSKTGARVAVLAILSALLAGSSGASGQCSFQILGPLPGLGTGSGTSALAVSADGQVVVGFAVHNPLAPLVAPYPHPFR